VAVLHTGADVVAALLNEGEGIDPNVQDKYGNTPLHYAAEKGRIDVISLLARQSNKIWCDSEILNENGKVAAELVPQNVTCESLFEEIKNRKMDRQLMESERKEREKLLVEKVKKWNKKLKKINVEIKEVKWKEGRRNLKQKKEKKKMQNEMQEWKIKLFCEKKNLENKGYTFTELEELEKIHVQALANIRELLAEKTKKNNDG